jgi:hypothetical protein
MERKNPFEIKFHNEYVNLIENLLRIYKSDKTLANEIKHSYLNYKKKYDRFSFIHETIEKMEPHIEAIKAHDEVIFCDEDRNSQVLLLANLDFKPLWGHPLLEEEHKTVIWKYLKNLYILGCHYIDRQDDHIKQILNQLKFDQLLQKKSEEEETESQMDQSKLTQDIMGLFNELFGKDSFIHELFKLDEVQSIIHEIKQNPLNAIRQYMNNGGQKIKETTQTISQRVKEKIMNGELDKDKIDRDIEKVHRIIGKLKSELPNDPRFKKFFEQIKQSFNIDITSDDVLNNPEELMKQFSQKFQDMSGVSVDELANKSPEELESALKNLGESNTGLSEAINQLDQSFAQMPSDGEGHDLKNEFHQQCLNLLRSAKASVEPKTKEAEIGQDLPKLSDDGLPDLEGMDEDGEAVLAPFQSGGN